MLHWKDGSVMQLHYYISAVVSASLLESFLWYIDYEYFNDTGTRPYTLTLLAVVVGAAAVEAKVVRGAAVVEVAKVVRGAAVVERIYLEG